MEYFSQKIPGGGVRYNIATETEGPVPLELFTALVFAGSFAAGLGGGAVLVPLLTYC